MRHYNQRDEGKDERMKGWDVKAWSGIRDVDDITLSDDRFSRFSSTSVLFAGSRVVLSPPSTIQSISIITYLEINVLCTVSPIREWW